MYVLAPGSTSLVLILQEVLIASYSAYRVDGFVPSVPGYQVLSGQLVTENRSVDMLEMVVARQRQLEAAMIPKEVRPLPLLQVSEAPWFGRSSGS